MAVSTVDELRNGRFEPVLHDVATSAETKRVIVTSGKVYYDLKQARDKANANVAILRLEQFYPFPQALLADALKAYPGATDIVWVQEEPRNMGAWPFLNERLAGLLADGQKLHYVGRPVAAAPATGSHHRHDDQQKALVARALGDSAHG
jgi:2-oxoglutarate dehydrogenase complex dehydrogenase (E1) component-like enzyme